jgi:MFS family permease
MDGSDSSMNSIDPPAASPNLHARLSALIFLAFAIMGSWMPVFTLHLKNLEFSPHATAWASAANAIGAMLAPLIWGQIADRWMAKERCIGLCAVISGCILWLLSVIDDPALMILGSITLWFFLIPVIGLTGAYIFRKLEHPDREYGRIRLWGTIGWMSASWGLTAWFTFAPIDNIDFADSLRLGGLAAFAVALYSLTLPHAPPSKAPQQKRNGLYRLLHLFDAPLRAMRMFRQRAFAVYCGCMFGFYVTLPFTIQLNPLLLERLGVNPSALPMVLTICQSLEVVLLAMLPMLLHRFGLRATMAVGALAWTFGLAALSFGSPVVLVLAALSTGGMFICLFVIAGQVFVNSLATPDIRASAQGLLIFINGSGLLFGHILVGGIRQWTGDNYGVAYLIATVISSMMFMLFAAGFSATEPAKTLPESLVPDAEMP